MLILICVGINAPKSVAVHREEIYGRIRREQQDEAGDKPKHTAEYVCSSLTDESALENPKSNSKMDFSSDDLS